MMLLLRQWWAVNRHLFWNAATLVGTLGVNSGLGFVYWWLAARAFPTAEVGLASAVLAAMALLAALSTLGLSTLIIGELARRPQQAPDLLATALAAAGAVGCVAGAMFCGVAPFVSPTLAPLAASIGTVLLFALGVGLTAITLVLDQAYIGLLRGELQFWRNALAGAIKLAALAVASVWLAARSGLSIYATWVLGIALSLALQAGYAAWRGWLRRLPWPDGALLRELAGTALGHHALNLSLQLGSLLLPLIVAVQLAPADNAYYAMAALLVAFVYVGPISLTTVLYAAGAGDPVLLAHRLRSTLAFSGLAGVVANIALWLGAPAVLGLFGADYAAHALWPLLIFGLGVFPISITEHFVAVCRIHERATDALRVVLIGGVLQLLLAAVGAWFGGLVGLSLGSMGVAYIQAFVLLPRVYRSAWGNHAAPPPDSNVPTVGPYKVVGS